MNDERTTPVRARDRDGGEELRGPVPFALYVFVIAVVLAYLEVQIEGPRGWAAGLPTWRTTDPRITWIFGGRPVTGYHIALNLLLLAVLHWPVLFSRWSLLREARVLSSFALLAVVWDFLWFVLNPHFGLANYDAAHVWWFSTWLLGVPRDYFVGIALAVALWWLPALVHRSRRRESLVHALLFVGTTVGVVAATAVVHELLSA